MHEFQKESTLYSYLNVKELKKQVPFWSLSDGNRVLNLQPLSL